MAVRVSAATRPTHQPHAAPTFLILLQMVLLGACKAASSDQYVEHPTLAELTSDQAHQGHSGLLSPHDSAAFNR